MLGVKGVPMTLDSFVYVFVSLFAVMNVLPVLPLFLSLTEDMPYGARKALRREAFTVSVAVGLGFCLAGALVLRALSLELADIRIAGGLVLLVFAVYDLLFSRIRRKSDVEEQELGVVPLGVPILMGPASMTALIVLSETRGLSLVLPAFALNALLNGLLIYNARIVTERLGAPFVRALGKALGIFLAALAVSMIRKGVAEIVASFGG